MEKQSDYDLGCRTRSATSSWSSNDPAVPHHEVNNFDSGGFPNGGGHHHHHQQSGRHHQHHRHHHNFSSQPPTDSSGGSGGESGIGGHSLPNPGRKRLADGGNFVKLFVGGTPRTVTEQDICSLFGKYGNIVEVVFVKDKRTGLQQEFCFVKYATFEEADQAIAVLHSQYTFSGCTFPIRVKYADAERTHPAVFHVAHANKLYVGCINKLALGRDIEEIFSPYGLVEDVFIARDELKQSRGFAFVQFSHREMAVAAIDALNGIYVMRGCDQPLVVRFAEPKKPKTGEPRPVPHVNDHLHRNGMPITSHQVSPSPVFGTHAGPLSSDTSDISDCDWSEHICPDGYNYYYNCVTCESRWEKPEEYAMYEEQLEKALMKSNAQCPEHGSLSASRDPSTVQVPHIQQVQHQEKPSN